MKAANFLRQQTHDLHRQTEAVAQGAHILNHSLSIEQYRSLIHKNLFIYQHLEPIFKRCLEWEQISGFAPFSHSRLDVLGVDARLLELPSPDYAVKPPIFPSAEQLLGGLYVLLGANLGGRVIYKHLRDNPQLTHFPDFHFYRASSAYPAREWPQFCRMLDKYLCGEQALEEAVVGARAVFCFVRDVHAAAPTHRC